MRFLKHRESGQALILVLILLALGGLMVVPALDFVGTSLNYDKTIEKKADEYHAADAGVHYALRKLLNSPTAFGSQQLPLEVNDRTVSICAENVSGPIYKVISTATTEGGSSTTITSHVRINTTPFDFGMASLDGDISMSGNAEVTSLVPSDGDIYSNGNIYMSANSEVDGRSFIN